MEMEVLHCIFISRTRDCSSGKTMSCFQGFVDSSTEIANCCQCHDGREFFNTNIAHKRKIMCAPKEGAAVHVAIQGQEIQRMPKEEVIWGAT